MIGRRSEKRIRPVILCGGAGTRLWPLSRVDRPKPFVSLDGGPTLFEQTLARVSDRRRFAPALVVVSDAYAPLAERLAQQSGANGARLLLEPVARGTAAAIGLAAAACDEDEPLLVLPSDHLIRDVAAFLEAVDGARGLVATSDWLVTFGLRPDRPETGYGYILQGEEVPRPDAIDSATGPGPGFRVETFVEKPDRARAEAFLAGGRHLWNAGIFLFRAGAIRSALARHAPYIADPVTAAMAAASDGTGHLRPDPSCLARSPSQSIDHAVMERSERVAVVPVDIGWSDVGSWEALYDVSRRDDADNAVAGDVVMIDSEGSLVRSDGPLVVGVGVRDMIVVATERSVLIVPRGDSQRVKEAVELLIRRGVPEGIPREGKEET